MRLPPRLVVPGAIALLALRLAHPLHAQTPARPDFSGVWVYDDAKNTLTGGGRGGVVSARMLGDRVTIVQNAGAITMTIANGAQLITARYTLDGSESKNVSPASGAQAEIAVTSRASWDGATLLIDSRSTSILRGQPVPVETRRVLAIDAGGFLVLDRTGTPAGVVVPTRSVYRKEQSPG